MCFWDTLDTCWHLWAAFVSEWHRTRDLHRLGFHKQHPDGKKEKRDSTASLPTRHPAPDANSLYSNLLNVIAHKPIKLNSLGVTAGFGHLCGRERHRAATHSCWNGHWCIVLRLPVLQCFFSFLWSWTCLEWSSLLLWCHRNSWWCPHGFFFFFGKRGNKEVFYSEAYS